MGGGGGKNKKPKVEEVTMPSAPATPPPPEPVAEAPVVASDHINRRNDRSAKKKGTSALRIDLATGGGGSVGGNGLSIPR